MHVWVHFHSNPTKVLDLSALVSTEAKCSHFFGLCLQTRMFWMRLLWCTVDGDDLFSCDFDFPKSSVSLVLYQMVQFNGQFNECCPVDGMKRKMTRNFKEINTPFRFSWFIWWTYLMNFSLVLPAAHRLFNKWGQIFTIWKPKDYLLEDAVMNSTEGTSHYLKAQPKVWKRKVSSMKR